MTQRFMTRGSRRAVGLLAGLTMIGALLPVTAPWSAPAPADAKNVDLTIYHIEQRRSFRVIWLAEELGIPYKLVFKRGDLGGSMDLIKKVNPLMPMAPTVDFRGQILVESGGILELLMANYAHGRLMPKVSSPDYSYYLQFINFAEGTGMYRIWATRYASMIAKIPVEQIPKGYHADDKDSGLVGVQAVLVYMDDFLSKHPYFGGQEFSAADIMMHMVARSSGPTAGVDSWSYPHIAAWRKTIQDRPAFKRAIGIAFPDGADKDQNACGMPIPFANPPAVFKCPPAA